LSDIDSAGAPRRRRTPRAKREPENAGRDSASRPSDEDGAGDDRAAPTIAETGDAPGPEEEVAKDDERATAQNVKSGASGSVEKRHGTSMVRVARRAAEVVGVLTGRHPESVISMERRDGDWCIGVEVIETRRIPDSADILATYEVLLSTAGDVLSYRRIRRYTRGQVDRPAR